jgi:peptidoglycan/LPS O-acetylase OafA/YrhL
MLLVPIYYMNVEYWHMYTWGLTTTFLGFACIVVWAIHLPYNPKHFLAFPVELLARIGFYSYSIYLWHWIIIAYLRSYLRLRCIRTGNPFVWTYAMEQWQWPVSVLFCIVAGIALAVLIEQPVLRLRDRWFPSRTRQLNALSM